MEIFDTISKNHISIANIGMELLVIGVWLILGFVFFQIVYKKVGVDN